MFERSQPYSWVSYCLLLIFSIEIFLGLYVYKIKSDYEQEYSQLTKSINRTWETEMRKILEEPGFQKVYGCYTTGDSKAEDLPLKLFEAKTDTGHIQKEIRNKNVNIEELCKSIEKCPRDFLVLSRKRRNDVETRGPPGPPGLPGPQGEKGDAGLIGVPGLPGPKGQKGDKGSSNQPLYPPPQIPTCLKGDKGTPGESGFPGLVGLKGEKGEQPDCPISMPVCVKGDKGTPGPSGLNCILSRNEFIRVEGDNGEVKCIGLKGDKGAAGFIGIQGPYGRDGRKGEKGNSGTYDDINRQPCIGNKGEKGSTGMKGDKGGLPYIE